MQLSLFLEVSKLLKLQGVVYFEGRLKSRYYGTSPLVLDVYFCLY